MKTFRAGGLGLAAVALMVTSCKSNPASPTEQTLFAKYGGAATVRKLVDDAVTGLLADCNIAPYFAGLGKPGNATADRVKSCLRLQFTALLGGPATYPGRNDQGDMCVDMATAHRNVGIPGPVFDRFISDLAAVLKADGVSDADINAVAPVLVGLKSQVVSANPVTFNACPR
jgi:truncated hemoglobin YjbI